MYFISIFDYRYYEKMFKYIPKILKKNYKEYSNSISFSLFLRLNNFFTFRFCRDSRTKKKKNEIKYLLSEYRKCRGRRAENVLNKSIDLGMLYGKDVAMSREQCGDICLRTASWISVWRPTNSTSPYTLHTASSTVIFFRVSFFFSSR